MTFATETRKPPATSQAAPLAEIAIGLSLARGSRVIPVDNAPLGGGLPPVAKRGLRLARLTDHGDFVAQRQLRHAVAPVPGHVVMRGGAVARRLPVCRLQWLRGDPDWWIRYELAGCFDADLPDGLLADADPLVRDHCRQRTGMHEVLAGACEA